MSRVAPCRNCIDRYLGCHDKCDKYQEFRAERNRMLEEKRKEREKNEAIDEIHRRGWRLRL